MIRNLSFNTIWYNSFLSKYNLHEENIEESKSPSFKETIICLNDNKKIPNNSITDEDFNKAYLQSKLDFRKNIIENILSEKGNE